MAEVYTLADGRKIKPGVPFEINGLAYQGNFLNVATAEELNAHHITKDVEQVDIGALKAQLMLRVDVDAESARQRFITPGAGQAMTYIEKHNQANAVHEMGQQAANALSEQDRNQMFPTLSASVGIEAATLWDAALLVIARYEAWATISHSIERAKLGGKKAISDASDAAAAQAAYEAIIWPQP